MKTQKRKRVDRIEKAIAAQPLRQDVVQKAFEHFCETGELPEEQRMADAVARQALRGGEPEDPTGASSDVTGTIFKILVVAEQRSRGEKPEPELPSVRECLFDEAVFGHDFIRHGARVALKLFVGFLEGDPTDPNFLADKTLPEHPGVGLHLLGYPERLVRRPYVKQARRLFARCDELRERIDHDDEAWSEAADEARDAFYERGELPADDLMGEVLLADLEMNALIAHKAGHDVSELMAVLDRAARAEGEERTVALASVHHLVRGGLFLSEGG